MSIDNGERNSTAKAYLDPARPRQNLKVVTDAQVQKILFNGNEAIGISYKKANGETIKVEALQEVILSAGAVGSPQLLMLSGVGPASHLREHGIPIVADLPGVGRNLNDHPDFVLKYRCLQPVSIWPQTRLIGRTFAGIRWILRRDGICASNQFEAVACVRSGAGVEYPDIQLTLSPAAVDDQTWKPLPEHAFQIHVGLMRNFSRGNITLRNADPATPPRILANYLKDPRDRDLLRKGIRIVREIVNQPAFKPFCGEEIYPGNAKQSDSELDVCIEEKLNTQWHLSGTARMGARNNREAVVDPHGLVHGISKLRIVDASIMPAATNGNTNSPTIMIAEKLSDSVLGKPPLARVEVPVWQNKNYETCQR
jgi:choline dehydrogenase